MHAWTTSHSQRLGQSLLSWVMAEWTELTAVEHGPQGPVGQLGPALSDGAESLVKVSVAEVLQ